MVSATVAVVGPTAGGKTALGLELARRYHGEIVCADSRTIYQGMDIGTAKPTANERVAVAHHMLDLIEPNERYSAQRFKTEAEAVIKGIERRHNLPIVVGGTGLYVYSLMYDYTFPAGPRDEEREELEATPLSKLVARLLQAAPTVASTIDLNNPRRVIRALETLGQPRAEAQGLKPNFLIIALAPKKDQLNKQIAQRTNQMFQIGLVDEVERIVAKYGPRLEVLRSPGYAEILDFLAGRISQEEAAEQINLHTRQLVRRQLTWLRRNPDLQWVTTAAEGLAVAETFLQPIL